MRKGHWISVHLVINNTNDGFIPFITDSTTPLPSDSIHSLEEESSFNLQLLSNTFFGCDTTIDCNLFLKEQQIDGTSSEIFAITSIISLIEDIETTLAIFSCDSIERRFMDNDIFDKLHLKTINNYKVLSDAHDESIQKIKKKSVVTESLFSNISNLTNDDSDEDIVTLGIKRKSITTSITRFEESDNSSINLSPAKKINCSNQPLTSQPQNSPSNDTEHSLSDMVVHDNNIRKILPIRQKPGEPKPSVPEISVPRTLDLSDHIKGIKSHQPCRDTPDGCIFQFVVKKLFSKPFPRNENTFQMSKEKRDFCQFYTNYVTMKTLTPIAKMFNIVTPENFFFPLFTTPKVLENHTRKLKNFRTNHLPIPLINNLMGLTDNKSSNLQTIENALNFITNGRFLNGDNQYTGDDLKILIKIEKKLEKKLEKIRNDSYRLDEYLDDFKKTRQITNSVEPGERLKGKFNSKDVCGNYLLLSEDIYDIVVGICQFMEERSQSNSLSYMKEGRFNFVLKHVANHMNLNVEEVHFIFLYIYPNAAQKTSGIKKTVPLTIPRIQKTPKIPTKSPKVSNKPITLWDKLSQKNTQI